MTKSATHRCIMTPSQIRALRKRSGLSGPKFARLLKCTGTDAALAVTVSRWETGKRKPSAQTIALMKQLAARGNLYLIAKKGQSSLSKKQSSLLAKRP